jgi:hypothetical protein
MGLRILCLCLLTVWLGATACVAAPLKDYKGADGGWLIFSVSTGHAGAWPFGRAGPAGTSVDVSFRRSGDPSGDRVTSTPETLVVGHKDLSGPLDAETRGRSGVVFALDDPTTGPEVYDTQIFALRMAPGHYEIYTVKVSAREARGTVWQTYDRRQQPFQITSGRALYLGAVTPVPRYKNNISGAPIFQGWSLVLDDEHERDLAVAQRATPDLGPVDNAWNSATPPIDLGDEPAQDGPH